MRLLSLNRSQAGRAFGGTTVTAYRRIHEVIGATLDRVVEDVKSTNSLAGSTLMDLSRGIIMVRYQNARRQISDELANILSSILNYILDKAQRGQVSSAAAAASRARVLLDALAVLVYEFGRK